jgi:hypothetical protein
MQRDVAEEDDGRKQSPAALRDNFKKKGVALLPVWLHPFISMLPITGPSIDGQSVFISDR